MSTFRFTNSSYRVVPPQDGAEPIINTDTFTSAWQQSLSGLPTVDLESPLKVNFLNISLITLGTSVGLTTDGPLMSVLLEEFDGFPFLDFEGNGVITSLDSTEWLKVHSGFYNLDDYPRALALRDRLLALYEELKDETVTIDSLDIGAYEGSPEYIEAEFNPERHYIALDASDGVDKLKCVKYDVDDGFQVKYWYDTGTGSGTTGLTSLSGRVTKEENRTVVTAERNQFDATDSSVVSTGSDTITIASHSYQDGDKVRYNTGVLHTFDATSSSIVDTTNDKIIISSHGFVDGDIVVYNKGEQGTDIGGLVSGTEYFVDIIDSDEFQLFNFNRVGSGGSVQAPAKTGSAIDITSLGKGTVHTFSGVPIGGLRNNTDYFVVRDSASTIKLAANEADAIAATPTVIDLTSLGKGTKHIISQKYLDTLSIGDYVAVSESFSFDGSSSSVISTSNNTITISDHGFATGDTAVYSAGGGTVVTGLEEGRNYFIIKNADDKIKLALTREDATDGTAVSLTGVGAGSSHSVSIKWSSKIANIESDNRFTVQDAVERQFTKRPLKGSNWNFQSTSDVIIAKVYKGKATAAVYADVSASTTIKVLNTSADKLLPGMEISGTGISGTPTIVEYNKLNGNITASDAQTISKGTVLTFTKVFSDPLLNLDSGSVKTDDNPALGADLDTNGKSLVNDAISLKTSTGSKNLLVGNTNAVELYYNDSKTFETVDGGISITGTTVATGDFAVDTDTLFVDVSADRVGVNDSTPSYALDVTGDIRATANIIAYSDERLKSDIKTLDGKKVLDMRGVEFIKDGELSSGVIAQELEKVAPELVIDDGEYKSVAYGNLVGYLIEAVKDLQKQVDELKK